MVVDQVARVQAVVNQVAGTQVVVQVAGVQVVVDIYAYGPTPIWGGSVLPE